ncbi:NAD(P)H-hydrate dehydratase [Candidatus Micrarchaeota archaeon]|nr:NAD(P)H-hydrate dehydratase [Candidatus Micrarchaeota archaeon]
MDGFVNSLYTPPKDSRKGDNGRLLIAGGSRDYHGAPVFALLAARRFVDLLYFLPAEKDAFLVNAVKTIPEAIVVDSYKSPAIRGKLDCVLYGIGLGDAKAALPQPKTLNTKLVIDGDGLKRVKGKIQKGAILTPHENEFKMLFGMEGSERNVLEMAKRCQCVILKKGPIDIIADGRPGPGCGRVETNRIHNQGMTKGGTGDVLAGLVAALACRNDAFTAAVAGARINGNAGNLLKKRFGYNYCASDLAEMLAESCRMLKGHE